MDKEKMMKGKDEAEQIDNPSEKKEESGIEAEIVTAIKPCLDRIKNGEYASKNEAIEALIKDLEAAKEEPGMGGLGIGSEGMPLPKDEEGDRD